MNSNSRKVYFAMLAVALMMLSPLALSLSNDDSDAGAIKGRGVIPEAVDYQYAIVQNTDGTSISDVQVYDGTNWSSKKTSAAGAASINEFWKFSNGLGPFNSFYAAINLKEQSNPDDLVEQRISTKAGGIAYVLDPDNLTKTMQGTTYSSTYYNIMLVIPTVYWMSITVDSKNYLLMSNQKADQNFDTLATGASFGTNARAYAHTFTDETGIVMTEPMPYIALGVYESYNNSGVLVSQPDRIPTASSTTNNINMHRSWAQANQTEFGNYMLWNAYQWTLYKMMAYTVIGNKDVQHMLGPGNVKLSADNWETTENWASVSTGRDTNGDGVSDDASSVTGETSAAYQDTTVSADKGNSVMLFLENAYGSVWEYVDDTYIEKTNNKIHAGNYLVFSEINNTTAPDTGVVFASTYSGKLISGTYTFTTDVSETKHGIWDMPTSNTNATIKHDGNAINDSSWSDTTLDDNHVLFVGGRWSGALGAGLAAANANDALGNGNNFIGSRLAYALTADAAVPSDSSATHTLKLDASDMVTVRAGNETIQNGDVFDDGTKLYITLTSRIPVGEKLIVTTYDMLGSPLSFTSSSAIGDEIIFTPEGDVFIYLDTGFIDSVVYQPIIYESDGTTVKEGKEAIVATLNQSATSYIWANERIMNSSKDIVQSDSFYFTGDVIVIELDKSSVTVTNEGVRYNYDGSTFTADANGAWAKGVASTTYYIAEGGSFYAMNNEGTPAMTEFVITSSQIEGINDSYNASLVKSTDHPGFFELTVTNVDNDLYAPYESTHYDDWEAGTYYFSLQTENSYVNVVNFPFKIGAYSVTVAPESEKYVDSVTVNGVERYKLDANEVAQIHLDAQSISGLDEYHVFITYTLTGDEHVDEVSPIKAGVYRFVMPAADVVISLTDQSSGFTIALMYTYAASDSAFYLDIVNNLGGAIPEGTITAEGYGVVGGKLYDGTSFSAIVHEPVFNANVTGQTGDYLSQKLDFTAGTYLTDLSTITAVVPVFSPDGSTLISGNQYFATPYTSSADNGAMSVKDGKVTIVNAQEATGDHPYVASGYTLTVYYNYDISTGESTKTVLTSFQVASGSLSADSRLNVINIDYEALGIDKDKVVMYRTYIAGEQTLDIAI